MSGCPNCGSPDKHGSGGPFATGRELVEFVCNAHDGAIKDKLIEGGGYETVCQGCRAPFTMKTHVAKCPQCGGVHAIAPIHKDASHIQFAGKDFTLDEG